MENWIINDGVLVEYCGPDVEVLVIPEGVTEISNTALYPRKEGGMTLSNCREIVFPETLKTIRYGACVACHGECFYGKCDSKIPYIGCGVGLTPTLTGLQRIVFKGDVEVIEHCAFMGQAIKEVVFEGNKIPNIGWRAIDTRELNALPEELFWTDKKIIGQWFDEGDYEEGYFYEFELSPKTWAYLYIFQTAKKYIDLFRFRMRNSPNVYIKEMLDILALPTTKAKAYDKVAEYIVEHKSEIDSMYIQKFVEMAKEINNKKALEIVQ